MTKIIFKRTGTDHEGEFHLDLDNMPGTEAQNLFHLIQEADFFKLPEQMGTAGTLDEPQFLITVEYGSGNQHAVSVNDAAVPDSLRPLVDELGKIVDAQSV